MVLGRIYGSLVLQWVSYYHRAGVYDGEEEKQADYAALLPPWGRTAFYLRHDVSEGAFSMLRKVYSQTGKKCRVTFEFLPEASVQTAYVCGEFNDWSTSAHPMKRRKDGTFTTMFWVEAGRAYRFRYLLDGEQWWNDPAADGYTANPYGGDDSLLKV